MIPATGKVLPDGQKGKLVITTLTKDGTPVLGRTDDMLIIRGVNVFPSQIEEVILKVEGIEPR